MQKITVINASAAPAIYKSDCNGLLTVLIRVK